MPYHFDKIADRRGTNSIKYDAAAKVFGSGDVLPLWIADSDFACPPFVIEALRRRLDHPVLGYTFRGPEFAQAVQEWVARRNGWRVEQEWIGFSPGVVAGFSMAIQALTAPGDGILIQPPVYPPFARYIRMNGRELVNNPLVWNAATGCSAGPAHKSSGSKYTIDFEDFEKKIERAKALLLCNPHNPTGRVFTEAELRRMGELCVEHDVRIISDEIHSDLILEPHRHIHIASLSDDIARRTITFLAPSKTFNVAGLSSSVGIIPDEALRQRFTEQLELTDASGGNIFGTIALVAAYRQGDAWLDALMEQIARNARYVDDFIRKNIPSVKTYVPEATFLMWLDFRAWGLPQDALRRKLIDAGLGLSDGADFGAGGAGFMRLNIATSEEVLKEAMKRLLLLKQ